MAGHYKRKADDQLIIHLNNVGLSMVKIGDILDVHHTTIHYRLRALGIAPVDTRRAFMDEIFESLTQRQQDWLMDQLGPGYSIKDFTKSLIVKDFISRNQPAKAS